MNSSGLPSGITNATAKYIEHNASRLAALPEPGHEFKWSDIADDVSESPQKLVNQNIITPTRINYRKSADDHTRRIYETRPRAYKRIQAVLSESPTLPCGHTGFTTVDADSGDYRCSECRIEFAEDVIKEVFGE